MSMTDFPRGEPLLITGDQVVIAKIPKLNWAKAPDTSARIPVGVDLESSEANGKQVREALDRGSIFVRLVRETSTSQIVKSVALYILRVSCIELTG